MADALVSVVLEQLFTTIHQEVGQEVRIVVGVRKEAKKLTDTLTIIQSVLKDAEEKQVNSGAVRTWLDRLKDISYDAEDLLDEWNTRILISQTQRHGLNVNTSTILNKVLSYLFSPFSCFKVVIIRHDIAQRIKEIRERLDVVAKDKDQYNFVDNGRHEEVTRPVTSSFVDVSEIYGRDDSIREIASKLLSESSHQDSQNCVISIVGMGGFGKTTLVQVVLKEEQVVANFEKLIYVCVSEPFDIQQVAKEIIEQAAGYVPNSTGWETLHKTLCDSLKGKLFLLVLDDVWLYDDKLWRQLKLSLDGGAPGSRIIITSRDERVAKMMNSCYVHRLERLSDDDCWLSFRQIAFRGRQNDFEKLEEIGKKIAKKCKGVPLTSRILATLVCLKESKRDWIDILESDIWDAMSEDVNGFSPELFLSYRALPSHLKPCFLYCASFKKDVVMRKDELVKLWMAQGFVGSDGAKNLEKIGADYFDNLALRSFFVDFKKNDEGEIISCKMHDLVHDFAQFLTKGDSSFLHIQGQEFSCVQGRHLSASHLENPSIYKLKGLRTLRPLNKHWIGKVSCELFHRFTCLRALDLHRSGLEELPVEVGELVHLRYLDLSLTGVKELPKTICNLVNLQTLKLNMCFYLRKLPDGIGQLSSLRHLEIEETHALSCLPQGIRRLHRLRTLSEFIVSAESEGCKFEELKLLNNLREKLVISGFKQVTNVNEAAQAELCKKRNLRELVLDFLYLESDKKSYTVVEGLKPPPDLQILEIVFYQGLKSPSWMSLLSNLVQLRLHAFRKCSQLPCLGKLPYLEDLHLEAFSSMKHIGSEFYGLNHDNTNVDGDITIFPRLKKLRIGGMRLLEEWELPISKDRKIMPCLSSLTLKDCDKLRILPALGKLESLESLIIENMLSLNHVGHEFLGNSNDNGEYSSVFPKLKRLSFMRMERWETWDMMPFQNDELEIFPNLAHLVLYRCERLRAFPALGRLKSLETLEVECMHNVKLEHVGMKFLGFPDSADNDCTNSIVIFPKLKLLHFEGMGGLNEWDLPLQNKTAEQFFPNLCELRLIKCGLQRVPPLGKLKSLQRLVLKDLDMVESLGNELLGFPTNDASLEDEEITTTELFSQLTYLKLAGLNEWKREKEMLPGGCRMTIMPHLHTLKISACPKLNMVSHYMFSPALRNLKIKRCPELTGMQPSLPLLLEKIYLKGDVGSLSNSLPISRCSSCQNYPNLKQFRVSSSRQLSLPEGFNQLTAIQRIAVHGSDFLMFASEDLKHLTMLQCLEIRRSRILSGHWRKEESSSTIQISEIIID